MNDNEEKIQYNRISSRNTLTMFNGQIKAFAHIKDFHVSTNTIGDRIISAILAIDGVFSKIKDEDKENVIDLKLEIYNVCDDEFSLTAPVDEVGFSYSITNRRTKSSYSITYKSTDNKKLTVVKTPNVLRPEFERSDKAITNRSFKSSVAKAANIMFDEYEEFANSTDAERENVLDEI